MSAAPSSTAPPLVAAEPLFTAAVVLNGAVAVKRAVEEPWRFLAGLALPLVGEDDEETARVEEQLYWFFNNNQPTTVVVRTWDRVYAYEYAVTRTVRHRLEARLVVTRAAV